MSDYPEKLRVKRMYEGGFEASEEQRWERDIEYVRSDLFDALRQRVKELEDQIHASENVISAVVGCCTYSSVEEAKQGIYGISPKVFTMIDEYIRGFMLPPTPPAEGEG